MNESNDLGMTFRLTRKVFRKFYDLGMTFRLTE